MVALSGQVASAWVTHGDGFRSLYAVPVESLPFGPTICRTGRSSRRAVLPMVSSTVPTLTALALASASDLFLKHPICLLVVETAHHVDPCCTTLPWPPSPG